MKRKLSETNFENTNYWLNGDTNLWISSQKSKSFGLHVGCQQKVLSHVDKLWLITFLVVLKLRSIICSNMHWLSLGATSITLSDRLSRWSLPSCSSYMEETAPVFMENSSSVERLERLTFGNVTTRNSWVLGNIKLVNCSDFVLNICRFNFVGRNKII